MPGGDRTGPTGGGPRTGRGAGFCTGNEVAGYANPAMRGRGGGMGRGRAFGPGVPVGRGLGRRFAGRGAGMGIGAGYGRQEYVAENERGSADIDALRREQDRLENELARLRQRLEAAGEQTGE